MVITTRRLFVRYLIQEDYTAFSTLESDPDVKKFSGGSYTIPQRGFERLVNDSGATCLAVCANDDSRFVGRCGFRKKDDRIELEIFLLPAEQGHGIGPELFDAMISYCYTAFPGSKVAATVSPANSRAINLLKNHNFNDSGDTVLTKAGFHSLYERPI